MIRLGDTAGEWYLDDLLGLGPSSGPPRVPDAVAIDYGQGWSWVNAGDVLRAEVLRQGAARITYNGRTLTLTAYCATRIRERGIRCNCGAPELGHAPDCDWIRAGDDAAQDFGDLWAEQGLSLIHI